MVPVLKADFGHEVREGSQCDGPGSVLPPPSPFVIGLAFSSIARLWLRAPF